ncbi:MAG: hypothetical protein WA919_17370 [Coleofasciculaceae cyanobacterium]
MSNQKKDQQNKPLVINIDPATLLVIITLILFIPLILAGFSD